MSTVKDMVEQLKRIERAKEDIAEMRREVSSESWEYCELAACADLLNNYKSLILKQGVQLEDGRETRVSATLKTADDVKNTIEKLTNLSDGEVISHNEIVSHLRQYHQDILCRQLIK